MEDVFVLEGSGKLISVYPFFISAFLCWVIIAASSRFSVFVDDYNKEHSIHVGDVPRVGGAAVFIGFLFGIMKFFFEGGGFYSAFLLVILPVFFIGILEDINKNISVRMRMIFAAISALLAIVLLDVRIERIDIQWFDPILTYPVISIAFTAFTIVGMCQAINIVDGLNGLSSMVSIMILCGIFVVSAAVNDIIIMNVSLCLIASLAGFFVFNFPKGKIFLGDGGAYFIGAAIAIQLIYLVQHHPRISPWFAAALTMYPVCETLYSISRRYINKHSPTRADKRHLHTLVFNISSRFVSPSSDCRVTRRNYMASMLLWFFGAMAMIGSLYFYKSTLSLVLFVCAFAIVYIVFYQIVSRFQPPAPTMIPDEDSMFNWLKFQIGDLPNEVDQEREHCVLCGSRTGVLVSENVGKRLHYVEGAGQLCAKCHHFQSV